MTFGYFLAILILSSFVLNFADVCAIVLNRTKVTSRTFDSAFLVLLIFVIAVITKIFANIIGTEGGDTGWRTAVIILVFLTCAPLIFRGISEYSRFRRSLRQPSKRVKF